MTSLATRIHVLSPHRRATGSRPSAVRLFLDQLRHTVQDLWRTRIAFVFTFLFPLTFLVVIGAVAGDATVSAGSSVRVMQLVTPSAAVMGALYGAFPTVASSLADARERGVLKRLRGTPVPGGVYLAGRVGAAVLLGLGSLALMLGLGVIAYGVQIQWSTMPATVVTVLAAVTTFAAAGVAVAGLARSATVAQAASIGTAVVVSMVSGVMGYGDMPTWADRIAQVFPVRPFNDALGAQFDPSATGAGWDLGALAVMGAWTVGAVVVAARTFRWEPVIARPRRRAAGQGGSSPAVASSPEPLAGTAATVTEAGRPGRLAATSDQARWAVRAALRDTGWVFFAIAFPLVQYVFTAALTSEASVGAGAAPPFGVRSATGMIAWGTIVTAMVFVPDAIAHARDQGILKRLRGTPLPIETYLAGRFLAGLALVLATAVLIVVTGLAFFDLEVAWSGIAPAAGLLVLGAATLGACGMLLVSILPSSTAVTAVGLGLAFPLAFFSDVFALAAVPGWMSTVGAFFPLKHLASSMAYALDPAGPVISWSGVAVMTAWLVVAAWFVTRRFRWSALS